MITVYATVVKCSCNMIFGGRLYVVQLIFVSSFGLITMSDEAIIAILCHLEAQFDSKLSRFDHIEI